MGVSFILMIRRRKPISASRQCDLLATRTVGLPMRKKGSTRTNHNSSSRGVEFPASILITVGYQHGLGRVRVDFNKVGSRESIAVGGRGVGTATPTPHPCQLVTVTNKLVTAVPNQSVMAYQAPEFTTSTPTAFWCPPNTRSIRRDPRWVG